VPLGSAWGAGLCVQHGAEDRPPHLQIPVVSELPAALPNVPFAGVVFTMPDVLWPIFRRNRQLSDDLPALGAAVIRECAKDANQL